MKPVETFLERSFERFSIPFEQFIRRQTTAGIFLIVAASVSIFLANSPWKALADAIPSVKFGMVFHHSGIVLSLNEWISSGLMALFFFLIGLEIKREVLAGALQDIKLIIPIFLGALGGMLLPAAIYWFINRGGDATHGWAIPTATDTAFALAALALSVKRIAPGVTIFLAALAIFDDIGAVLVVALFYTRHLDYSFLIQAIVPLSALFSLNLIGVRRGSIYFLFGALLWWCIHRSGIHATMAGLLMALTVPARTQLGQRGFADTITAAIAVFERKLDFGAKILEAPGQHSLAMDMERTVKSAVTPLQRWHSFLVNPVGIIVLPLFALFNAGIEITGASVSDALTSPVTMGIVAGLVVGKPLGIVFLILIALKLRIGKLPEGVSEREVVAIGLFSGIGFTMSLFITALSFQGQLELIQQAKLGIIVGSIISVMMAYAWSLTLKKEVGTPA